MLENYAGKIEVNGQSVAGLDFNGLKGHTVIRIMPNKVAGQNGNNPQVDSDDSVVYRITVKRCMIEKASPQFDFMAKWNNDNPMPLRTMVGEKVKETRGMVYMKLHGDTTGKIMQRCLRCGRLITNPVSQYFGMGPECGGHNYTSPFDSDEELLAAVDTYRKDVLQKMTWEGWIIKSCITECEEVK